MIVVSRFISFGMSAFALAAIAAMSAVPTHQAAAAALAATAPAATKHVIVTPRFSADLAVTDIIHHFPPTVIHHFP